MSVDPISAIRTEIGRGVAEIAASNLRLPPIELHRRLDAIRSLAAANGLHAVEGLARYSAQAAMRPGHRTSLRTWFEHLSLALDGGDDCETAILAAVAIRLR